MKAVGFLVVTIPMVCLACIPASARDNDAPGLIQGQRPALLSVTGVADTEPALDTSEVLPLPPKNIKIVGGEEVEPGEYPFVVALISSSRPPGLELLGQICGGSLIARDWVLTAAHCVTFVPRTASGAPAQLVNLSHKEIDVQIDTVKLADEVTEKKGERRHLANIIVHPLYEKANGNLDCEPCENDIALLELSSAASSSLKPVNLPPAGAAPAVGSLVRAVGWGLTQTAGGNVSGLRQVGLDVQHNARCLHNYAQNAAQEGLDTVPDITAGMLCTGFEAGGKDTCNQDSGGPVFSKNAAGDFVQDGVIIWGARDCAKPGLFGVNIRVADHVDWIRDQADL